MPAPITLSNESDRKIIHGNFIIILHADGTFTVKSR